MRVPTVLILCLIAAMVLAFLSNAESQIRAYFLPRPDTQKFAVIFGGAAADETYQAQFRQWTLKLQEILVRDYGYPANHVTLLLGRGDPWMPTIAGPCRIETILAAMEQLRKKVRAGDQITVFFIGHGTSDDQDARFVIAGPDITGTKFAEILEGFPDQDLAVVNTTSASHPFCSALSAPGRVIVCATRSAAQRYDTIFPRFLITALESHAADRDKNGRVSLFETFLFVRQKVNSWYTEQDRLPSEHPTLDDNGDGRLQTDPDPARDDGRLAQIAEVDSLATLLPEVVAESPALETLRKLAAQVRALERSIILLKHQKTVMPEADYWQQLEPLLIDLARSSRRMRNLRVDFQKVYTLDE
ncbi:MAG: hypothetical protein PVH37_18980 [Desulfobacterales bacterium]